MTRAVALTPALCWPAARLSDALDALVGALGWAPHAGAAGLPPENIEALSTQEVGTWLAIAAEQLGVELESRAVVYATAVDTLRGFGPGVLRTHGDAGGYVAVVRCRGVYATIVAPDRRVYRVPFEALCAAFSAGVAAPHRAEVDAMLEAADVPRGARARAGEAVLLGRVGDRAIPGCWAIRRAAGRPFGEQLRGIHAGRRLGAIGAAYVSQYVLATVATIILGRGAISGTLDLHWMLGWALLMVSVVPVRMAARWLAGALAVDVEMLVRRRLLAGVMRLEPDELRQEGAGRFLGRVYEAEALQPLAIGGGLSALFAALDLALAAVVVSQGTGGAVNLALLVATLVVVALGVRREAAQTHAYASSRMTMTQDLLEKMLGHRTRLAQQPPHAWHQGEDEELARYLAAARDKDQTVAWLAALPRAFTVLAAMPVLAALLDARTEPTRLALALFGVVLAQRALRAVIGGSEALVGAWVSWGQVRLAFHAAARPVARGARAYVHRRAPGGALEAIELRYHYAGRATPVLRGATLRVADGDRVLLHGPSGSGKSTLASILAGLRSPDSGLLLAHGVDPQTTGAEGWRRRVTIAPQFHENHVFSGTLAFNLLMGRRWPPTRDDVLLARRLLTELELDVVERMPNQFSQLLGETGWQLSHGERSRLFIARALLQGADVIIFDESLGALDPERHRRALECIDRNARSLVLVTHS